MRSCLTLKAVKGGAGVVACVTPPLEKWRSAGSLGLTGKPAQPISKLLVPVRTISEKKERRKQVREGGRERKRRKRRGRRGTKKEKGIKKSSTVFKKKSLLTLATVLSSSYSYVRHAHPRLLNTDLNALDRGLQSPWLPSLCPCIPNHQQMQRGHSL